MGNEQHREGSKSVQIEDNIYTLKNNLNDAGCDKNYYAKIIIKNETDTPLKFLTEDAVFGSPYIRAANAFQEILPGKSSGFIYQREQKNFGTCGYVSLLWTKNNRSYTIILAFFQECNGPNSVGVRTCLGQGATDEAGRFTGHNLNSSGIIKDCKELARSKYHYKGGEGSSEEDCLNDPGAEGLFKIEVKFENKKDSFFIFTIK